MPGQKRPRAGGPSVARGGRAPPKAPAPAPRRALDEDVAFGADSDSDDVDEAVPDAPPAEASLEDLETADAKRLRLARAYLGKLSREVRGGASSAGARRGPFGGREEGEVGEEEAGGEEEE